MTIHVSMGEIQKHFPELFEQVLNGEEVVIAAENGREVARLTPSPRKTPPEKQALSTETESNAQESEQTLDKALEGLIGVVSLENAPADLSERTGHYFTEILAENSQKEPGRGH